MNEIIDYLASKCLMETSYVLHKETYLTTKQVRILVPLTMLEQHSLLEKLLVAALGIHMLFVYGAEVLLQILEAFGHKLTFVADKWAEFPDQFVHVFVACVNFWFCCRNRRIDCS